MFRRWGSCRRRQAGKRVSVGQGTTPGRPRFVEKRGSDSGATPRNARACSFDSGKLSSVGGVVDRRLPAVRTLFSGGKGGRGMPAVAPAAKSLSFDGGVSEPGARHYRALGPSLHGQQSPTGRADPVRGIAPDRSSAKPLFRLELLVLSAELAEREPVASDAKQVAKERWKEAEKAGQAVLTPLAGRAGLEAASRCRAMALTLFGGPRSAPRGRRPVAEACRATESDRAAPSRSVGRDRCNSTAGGRA